MIRIPGRTRPGASRTWNGVSGTFFSHPPPPSGRAGPVRAAFTRVRFLFLKEQLGFLVAFAGEKSDDKIICVLVVEGLMLELRAHMKPATKASRFPSGFLFSKGLLRKVGL